MANQYIRVPNMANNLSDWPIPNYKPQKIFCFLCGGFGFISNIQELPCDCIYDNKIICKLCNSSGIIKKSNHKSCKICKETGEIIY